jgi:hypothetical protein
MQDSCPRLRQAAIEITAKNDMKENYPIHAWANQR